MILSSSLMAAEIADVLLLTVNDQRMIFQRNTSGDSVAALEGGLRVLKTVRELEDRTELSFSVLGTESSNFVFSLPISRINMDEGAGWGADLFTNIDVFYTDQTGVQIFQDVTTVSASDWVGLATREQVVAVRLMGQTLSSTLTERALVLQPTTFVQSYTFEILHLSKTLVALSSYGLDGLIFANLWDWFRWFCLAIWSLLEMLYALVANWGATILILALLVKMITYPITKYALRYQDIATEQQIRIAPLLKEIKSTHTGVEQSEQIVKLYELQNYQHGAPFKSLLGIGIQIPVLVALFNILGNVSALNGVSFLWINDLTVADRLLQLSFSLPYFGSYLNLLPIALGIVTFVSMAYTNNGWDRSGLTKGLAMGGLFFVLFYSFPAALVLYWLAANLLQFVQQLVIGQK